MICQKIFRKAEKQLLSLCSSLCHHNAQNIAKSRCLKSVVLRYSSIHMPGIRSLSSVPSPPLIENLLSNKLDDQREDSQCIDEDNEKPDSLPHISVMVEEVLSCLDVHENQVVLDMTFGAGGHARQILKACPGVSKYIGVDRDPLAFNLAKKFASEYRDGQVIPLLSKFSELPVHLKQTGVEPGTVDCVLMDLGVSSMQFDSSERGFSLSRDGPLDMRMDGKNHPDSLTAADVVNTLEPHELARILKKYGEEKKAKAIAHAIVEARYAFGPFTRTKQLADIIKSVFESQYRHDKLHRHSHVATKTFQALRIFVNDELNEIHNGLEVAHRFLKPNGRCAAIAFHSLEDRIVKRHFHGIEMDLATNITIHSHHRNSNVAYDNDEIKHKFLSSHWLPLKRKISEASKNEVVENPRARSAKLRAAVKVEDRQD